MLWRPAVITATLSLLSDPRNFANAHGYLDSPRSRNVYAHEVGPLCANSGEPECPVPDYCPHCLNTNDNVCGKFSDRSFDNWVDTQGNQMPWISQEVYEEGGLINVKSYLDTHHNGHMEMRACNKGPDCTPADFEANKLTFVLDTVFENNHLEMKPDPAYPERGMYAGGQGGSTKSFQFVYQLPMGIYGERVLLQWKYITANSCSPPGYTNYFASHPEYPASYWTPGLGECSLPYPNDGTRSEVWPEQFFNCAEVTVLPATPAEPTASPQPSALKQPTDAPIENPTCKAEYADCTNDMANSCCNGFVCTSINGLKKLCLVDVCEGGPMPSSPSPPTNWLTPNPTPPPTPANQPTNQPIVGPTCKAEFGDCTNDGTDTCCQGYVCTQVDIATKRCLIDSCSDSGSMTSEL